MGILKKLKEFTKQVIEVENNLYSGKQDFLEIYERNAQLEEEIEQRTHELNIANRRMLTLQHIWEMMNSSKPLSSVLETTVNTLKGEFGYLHSAILQKKEDSDGVFWDLIASSTCTSFSEKILDEFKCFGDLKIPYSKNNILGQVLKSKKVTQSQDLREGLNAIVANIGEEKAEKILSNSKTRSFILVPLYTSKKAFGILVVLSSRDQATEGELNFLAMFAQQIELAITIADLFQVVKEQAVTDALTGLYNRRHFEEYLEKEVTRAKRHNHPFTIIGLDLDHLKQINDKYGHHYGDLAIKKIADVLKQNARSIDIPARMGGEEFNVLLPGVDSQGGLIAAERIRKAIEASSVETIGQITASVGVSTFLEHSNEVDELLELADQAMYQSKRNGRNQVTIAKPSTEVSWQEVAINAFIDILSKQRLPIEKELSDDLCEKLQFSVQEASSPREVLYGVADILAKMYNPNIEEESTKHKVYLAQKLAKKFELSLEDTDRLRVAMLLYDIGNLMIPKEILQKETPLSQEEQNSIQTHPVLAVKDILQPISNIQDIIPIIEKHHENWDGSGYPNKLAGNDIPITSQIILITDAYCAMTSKRPYRKAMTKEEALEVIKNDAGKKWNEKLVQEFIEIVN